MKPQGELGSRNNEVLILSRGCIASSGALRAHPRCLFACARARQNHQLSRLKTIQAEIVGLFYRTEVTGYVKSPKDLVFQV